MKRAEQKPVAGEQPTGAMASHFHHLYTLESLGTLGGSALAVCLTVGVADYLFHGQLATNTLRLVGFAIAQLAAIAGLLQIPLRKRRGRRLFGLFIVTVLNGVLIYSNAVGFNTINHGFSGSGAPQKSEAAMIPVFASKPWWPPADMVVDLARSRKDAARCSEQLLTLEQSNEELRRTSRGLIDELTAVAKKKASAAQQPPCVPKTESAAVRPLVTAAPDASQVLEQSTSRRDLLLNSSIYRPFVRPYCGYESKNGRTNIAINVEAEYERPSTKFGGFSRSLLNIRCTGTSPETFDCSTTQIALGLGFRGIGSQDLSSKVETGTVETEWPVTRIKVAEQNIRINWRIGWVQFLAPPHPIMGMIDAASCGRRGSDGSPEKTVWGSP